MIDLTTVLNSDGKEIHAEEMIGFETFVSRLGEFPITSSTPVSLTIKNKGNQELQLSGMVTLHVLIPCSRCLEDVDTEFVIEFDKELDMKMDDGERQKALDEHSYIEGYNLDVDELVYGEILVNWPVKVLCQEDCKGICSVCGTNLNLSTCSCETTDLDPRMAKIRDIFSKFKEV